MSEPTGVERPLDERVLDELVLDAVGRSLLDPGPLPGDGTETVNIDVYADAAAEAEAVQAQLGEPGITVTDVARIMRRFSEQVMAEWAGIPTPHPDFRLVVEERYPYAEIARVFDRPSVGEFRHECRREDMYLVRNAWWSRRHGRLVYICEELDDLEAEMAGEVVVVRPRIRLRFGPPRRSAARRVTFWLELTGACLAWDVDAEEQALGKLAGLVTARQFDTYRLTGSFTERSGRSGLTYLFRRSRPTVALTARRADGRPGDGLRVLACLCLHPIAYYEGTWAGAMVPTDDVIAHLLLMRGDEHLFWRRANQHDPDDPEAGL